MKRSSLREREVMRGSESCSFPWRLALRSAAQGTNLKASHHDDGDDGDSDSDLYIIGAVCLSVTKVIILPNETF